MIYEIDPITDRRWAEFVEQHASSSVFHTPAWLSAIQQTYGYKAIAYTTAAPGHALSNGIVLCQINSWLTGRRMVSLPFSDHCEPLMDGAASAEEITGHMSKLVKQGKWDYIELRPTASIPGPHTGIVSSASFLHRLDLTSPTDLLLKATHKTAIQQPIKRAEREGLSCESGNSDQLLRAFYKLMLGTRRKHQLPPQPYSWFKTLNESMGEKMQIRVAFQGSTPVASVITLAHLDTLVYKYSCSDVTFQNLGGTPFLLWKAVLDAKERNLKVLDLGRSDTDNPGLITFKNRWGAAQSELTYYRWSNKPVTHPSSERSASGLRRIFSAMPDFALQMMGTLLYRHVG